MIQETLIDKDCDICKRYRNGESLFRLALELQEDAGLCDSIRAYDAPTHIPIARLLVWFLDFYTGSRGRDFRKCSWDKDATANKVWERAWKCLRGQCPCPGENWRTSTSCSPLIPPEKIDCNRPAFLSKWWMLSLSQKDENANSPYGYNSDIWQGLTTAIHSYRERQGEIRLAGSNEKAFGWIQQLMCEENTPEHRVFVQLIHWLATGEPPEELRGHESDEEMQWWKTIYETCQKRLGAYAWFDWYVRLPEAGGHADFGIGFDSFPDHPKDNRWRNYTIITGGTQEECTIAGDTHWFVPTALTSNTTLKYGAKKGWETMDRKVQTDNVLFPRGDLPFGVFIRHRMGRNWWREADLWWDPQTSPPSLGRRQKDILICARDKEALQQLEVRCEGVEIEYTEREQTFKNPPSRETLNFPICIVSVVKRPDNDEAKLVFSYQGIDFCQIAVAAMKPEVVVDGNPDGVEMAESPDQQVIAFDGLPIRMTLNQPRQGHRYHWWATLDQALSAEGEAGDGEKEIALCLQIPPTGDANAVHDWEFVCKEDGKKTIRRISKGILFPKTLRKSLKEHCPCPVNWSISPPPETYIPVPDWIEGKTQIRVTSPSRQEYLLRIPNPPQTPHWWFERGLRKYWMENGSYQDTVGRKFFSPGEAPQLEAQDIEVLYLCLPEQDVPRGWERVGNLDEEGYWRCSLRRLLVPPSESEAYIYDPEPQWLAWPEKGIPFFKYKPILPSRCRFCKDTHGRLGVFRPQGVTTRYVAYGFSDRTSELLQSGKKLDGIQQPCFFNLQASWDEFCNEVEGHDAILALLPQDSQERGGLFAFLMQEMEVQNGAPFERCILRRGNCQEPYGQDILGLVKLFKTFYPVHSFPETHPLRDMRVFTTDQSATDAETRLNWLQDARRICQTAECQKKETWSKLFAMWQDSGFHPLLEGVDEQLLLEARQGYLSFPPAKPKQYAENLADGRGWSEFIVFCMENLPQISVKHFKGNQEFISKVRMVCSQKITKKLLDSLADCMGRYKRGFEYLCTFLKTSMASPWPLPSKNPSDIQQQYAGLSPTELYKRLVQHNLLQNAVNETELLFSRFPDVQDSSPVETLESIKTPLSKDPRTELLVRLLEGMAERRQVRWNLRNQNESCEIPTNREWLFCLAAVVCLIHVNMPPPSQGAEPPPITVVSLPDSARKILGRVFMAMKDNPGSMAKFQQQCHLLLQVFQLRQVHCELICREIFESDLIPPCHFREWDGSPRETEFHRATRGQLGVLPQAILESVELDGMYRQFAASKEACVRCLKKKYRCCGEPTYGLRIVESLTGHGFFARPPYFAFDGAIPKADSTNATIK